ncbi:hypothetical protein GWR56_03570 [Mucilaginibacter sp. 14171R-50]|uniref:hypothetical protein n=1 Tax=Mucilaginibacter sp. 14171R-50 TaxID=2703789 RepID=UPI00138B47F9|nr:hypothetical protein [Mucilaginibacter sp. 14171R-50]QHS54666.1 hypothetical protein GWR56_03570 [Mucilaginibacter sp. 14171R-50]
MISVPCLSYANNNPGFQGSLHTTGGVSFITFYTLQRDTIVTKGKPHQSEEDKKKIKEVAKAKKVPKPEKIEPAKPKPKRQRRPEGLERPPEIPRRND